MIFSFHNCQIDRFNDSKLLHDAISTDIEKLMEVIEELKLNTLKILKESTLLHITL